MEILSTKDKIMKAALSLFSVRGYEKVSMRDIAAEVGIKAASIYNHFPSKRDILKNIYRYCVEQKNQVAPSLDKLLLMAETEDPGTVLQALIYQLPPESQKIMDAALVIASKGINGHEDMESERFIREYLFTSSMDLLEPLLTRLIELGKIASLDVEVFSYIVTYYTFSAAILNPTNMRIGLERWVRGFSMLFSLIKIC